VEAARGPEGESGHRGCARSFGATKRTQSYQLPARSPIILGPRPVEKASIPLRIPRKTNPNRLSTNQPKNLGSAFRQDEPNDLGETPHRNEANDLRGLFPVPNEANSVRVALLDLTGRVDKTKPILGRRCPENRSQGREPRQPARRRSAVDGPVRWR
jgi:hypothetical protein